MHFCLYFILFTADGHTCKLYVYTNIALLFGFPLINLKCTMKARTVPVFSHSQIVQRALAPTPSIPRLLRHVLIPWLLIQYQCCRPSVFCILFGSMSIFVWHFGNRSVVPRCHINKPSWIYNHFHATNMLLIVI